MFGTHEENTIWLNLHDPPGIIMAIVTYSLIAFVDFGVSFVIVKSDWNLTVIVVFNIIVLLAVISHLRTMLTNPGAVPHQARPLANAQDTEMICGRCDAYKPPVSHHCRVCGRCIVRMDHHVSFFFCLYFSSPNHTQLFVYSVLG